MTSEKISRRDKNQNIQVFVRLRPLNQRELISKSLGAVEAVSNREVVVRQSQNSSLTKKFSFDKAFGPYAKQVEIYQAVVSPLIEEVLAGYNCTVFAYGQTGTGKTHTMVGENTTDCSTTWQNDPLAGIIPRALSQLFDELRLSNTEYTVRVSYLELYNEELFDLLSTSEDNSKLRIYEDVTRKGSNIVNGLEEITVYNKNEVYKIMEQGQERKKVASTLMNAQSSRSHTVFTIVVHMKENSPEGEELVKIGKLNLVDLAGSENISKAGTDNPAKKERARECVNINQSLLTLGRVITALVERHPHIPYRESKLTRILQESLGGRTKTSIIATISPGHKDLEETMSTLEYAHRAKNIQNKPEVNQKLTKKAILKEYSEEIDRLKRDLQAARDKNGVYLANETFAEMTIKEQEQRKEIQDLLLQKRAMEEKKERMENLFGELSTRLEQRENELEGVVKSLVSTKEQLTNTSNILKITKVNYEEQKHLVSKQLETEQKLSQQAKALVKTADKATSHLYTLQDRVDTRRTIESRNLEVTRCFREQSTSKRAEIESLVDMFTQHLSGVLECLLNNSEQYTTNTIELHGDNENKIFEVVGLIDVTLNQLKGITQETTEKIRRNTKEKRNNLHSTLIEHCTSVEGLIDGFVRRIDGAVSRAETVRGEGAKSFGGFVEQWLTSSKSRITSLQNLERSLMNYLCDWRTRNVEEVTKRKQKHKARHDERREAIHISIEELETDRRQMEESIKLQLQEIDNERASLEQRLQEWTDRERARLEESMERERARLEERIQEHSREQRACLEERLTNTTRHIECQRVQAEERITKYLAKQQELLTKCEEDVQLGNEAIQERDSSVEECVKYFVDYNKTFDLESSAVSIDMSAFCDNLKQVLEHINSNMMSSIVQVKNDFHEGAKQVVLSYKADTESFAAQTDSILSDIVNDTESITREFVQRVEENNATVTSNLNTIATQTLPDQIKSSQNHFNSQSTQMKESQAVLCSFKENISREVKQYGEMEGKFLLQEYAVYKPSGETPVRQDYSYPRTLAATSPHERILARFRACSMDTDDECVVIEDETESTEQPNSSSSVSDSASIESNESAADFLQPSPPSPLAKCKWTSEGDVYLRSKNNGKENTERLTASSTKKPSRLPAPSSLKKPFLQRNTESS